MIMRSHFAPNTFHAVVAIMLACVFASGSSLMAQTDSPTSDSASPSVTDYSKLAQPEVASAVKLTNEQQAGVQQIIAEREAATAAADEPAKAGIVNTSNLKLRAILTADQHRLFESLFSGKTLRFNFRSQKWPEVLDWIAREADLSLVMETPPPGVFNYSDSKDYTTTESIDLLNGWLLTKGFTLVRRERMLMCLDLKGGLPEGAVPRITPEELGSRGRYEFVSILFPLDGRPPESVLTEVKPLLGSYGKAEALAQTQQLLVYDTAANLRVIEQIVKKIPIPEKPPGPAPEPPKPVLVVYPIEHANPAQAGEVLKQIVTGTLVIDEKARQISVNAIPSEQEKARTIIGQLESNQGPDMQPTLQLYSVQVSDADQMLATLKLIAPEGQYRIDPISGQLISWATPRDQSRIAASLEKIQAEQPQGGGRQLVVYPLQRVDPASLSTILATVVPNARITVNPLTRSLIAFGSPADHEAIRTLIETTEAKTESEESERELRTYSGPAVVASSVISLLSAAVPNAQVLADAPNQRLLVMASAAEHTRVDLLLKSLSTAENGGKQLRLYDSERIDVSSVTSLLSTLVPQATVTSDSVNKRLLIMATEEDHEKVTETLEQVQLTEADVLRSVKSYPMQSKTSSATVVSLLTSLVPKAVVSTDEANRRLLITASENEHLLIQEVLKQVETEAVGVQPVLKFYPLVEVDGPASIAVLQSITPAAKITYLPDGNRFSVIAVQEDHAAFATALKELETAAAEMQRTLKFYDVAEIGASDVRALLSSTFADVKFIATAEQNKLMARVSADQDERIQALLNQLKTERPFEATRTMELYSIVDLGPTASTVLGQAVPDAAIIPGARPDQLAIVATAADHKKLKTVLQQLQGAKVQNPEKTLTVHQIRGTSPSAVLQVLQPLVDTDVQLTVDNTGKQIFVRAVPEKQERIKAVVAQVTASLSEASARSTKTYFIGAPNADEAQEVLAALFPDATIVIDSERKMIVATATAEQHVTIEQVSKEMKGEGLNSDSPVPVVFSLKNTAAVEVQTLLQSMYSRFDNVRVSVNEKTGRLVVVARPAQIESIRRLIEQLDLPGEPASKQELAVFALHHLDGMSVQQALRPLLPQTAQVTADRIGRQLFVSASAEEMPAIRELVRQLISSPADTEGLETRSYRLRRYEADEAQEVLARLFPDATLVTDVSQEMLVATATPAQHETIADVVEQMTSTERIPNGPQARVYPLKVADGSNIAQVFSTMFTRTDDVRVSFDAKSRTLIAVARPEQHELIQSVVDQLSPANSAFSNQTVEVYPLSGLDGLTAVEFAEGLLQSVDPSATVSWQKTSRQLIVSTTLDGHRQLNTAMSRLEENESREMDVIQLQTLSASSAQNAIEGLYGDSFSRDDDYPVIQADEDLQQLLIRGSKKQLVDIRALLIKMGEVGLTQDPSVGASNRNLRVIALPGDVEPVLRKIQDLWPRVRRNPIRVLRPDGETKPLAPGEIPPADSNGQFSIPPEHPVDDEVSQPISPTIEEATDIEQRPHVQDNIPPEKAGVTRDLPLASEGASEQPSDTDQQQSSPVIIIPGPGRLTIASDDPDALDQMESILRATLPRSSVAGTSQRNRDFSVYQLRNAGAEDVAETLESIYESREGMLAFGSVVIVPETRMNALIVYGGRTDRDRIEQLLEILDTEKLPDSGRIFRTEVLPVQHADAGRIEDVLRGVYRTEMTAGGTRRAIEIPAGVDSSVASVLRQINAASSAPLLTIEVQTETNSLVVKAPQTLIDELRELIAKLDETAATNRARGVTLIPLKQTNTRRVMQILNNVLED